jgi:hypothetical protein
MSDAKVVIAGAGRAGTALLLQVLTDLGLDTGFARDHPVAEQLAAGAAVPPESPKAPRIVTGVGLAHRLGPMLDVRGIDVEHVIVPIRDLDVAVASRLRATAYGARLDAWDPPTQPSRPTRQREALGTELYRLVRTIAHHDLAHTLLEFPRFATDWRYLQDRLGFLDLSIPPERWRDALRHRADPERIHETRSSRRERLRTAATELVDDVAVRPARALRRLAGDPRARPLPVSPASPERAGADGAPVDVTVHVASINTRFATELCIRTMRRYAGHPFRLVVGDCGSTDGSLGLLRDYERRGWLTLEVAPDGRQHAEWLDRWLRDCPTRFAVFCDSDIEFFEPGWLDDMVRAARDNDAAMVCTELIPSRARFVHPHTGARRTLGARPAPWLLLVDAQRTRGRLDAGFGYVEVDDPAAFGGIVGYDVGGAFFAGLRAVGFGWVQLPDAFRSKYHHFSGLSWRRVFDRRAPSRLRPGQLPRMATVVAHLLRARALRYGEAEPRA